MKILLRLKHWQLFGILVILPVALQIAVVSLLILEYDFTEFLPIIGIIIALIFVVLFGWIYELGVNLYKISPANTVMKITKFKVAFFTPILYIVLLVLFLFVLFAAASVGVAPDIAILYLILPVHLFSIACILYCLYFTAKALKAVELQRRVAFSECMGEFFMLWFFPIGIWVIQPRINKLFTM